MKECGDGDPSGPQVLCLRGGRGKEFGLFAGNVNAKPIVNYVHIYLLLASCEQLRSSTWSTNTNNEE